MGTVQSNTTWHVVVVPWTGEVPSDNPQGGAPFVLPGVKAISFNRSKGSPAGSCSVQCIGSFQPDHPKFGPGKPGLKVGDWVVVYSNNNIAPNNQNVKENNDFFNATGNGVPRFFGQVSDIDSDYDRDENGRLRRVHSVHIKEWSSFLLIPVRYDTTAPALMLAKSGLAAGTALLSSLSSSVGGDLANAANAAAADTQDSLQKVASTLFSAFALAQLTLKYIDGLSSNNQVEALEGLDTKLPNVAVRMPAVPSGVFDMLGISGANPDRPFSTGMVTCITGVQTDPIHNEGTWNGVYDANEFTTQGQGDGFDQDPADRPKTIGLQPLMCQGMGAWQIMNAHCDTSVNEIFTDMTFEFSSDGKSIVPKPFICVRDKPFALAKLLASSSDASAGSDSSWTKYDDLPRIWVASDYIMRARIRRSMADTATYIRLNFNPQEVGDPQSAKWASEEQATINKTALQKRFGGQELFLDTTFIAADPGTGSALASTDGGNAAWFKKLKNIIDIWYSNMYRMASCQLIMKDHNVALTVGYNLQFTLGGVNLVGHIESISADFVMGDDGNRHTTWSVSLSRVCCVNADGDLDFLPQDMFSNLKET